MKKVAFVFVLAVFLPSLVLAWLAVRSLRDQQYLIEHQQSLLYQRVTDSLAGEIADHLNELQQQFSSQVEELSAAGDIHKMAANFDVSVRKTWPLAEVGFCVNASGAILSPKQNDSTATRKFYENNGPFLKNRESAEVYGNINSGRSKQDNLDRESYSNTKAAQTVSIYDSLVNQKQALAKPLAPAPAIAPVAPAAQTVSGTTMKTAPEMRSRKETSLAIAPAEELADVPQQKLSLDYASRNLQTRNVMPGNLSLQTFNDIPDTSKAIPSKVVPAETDFGQLIGTGSDGMIGRFLQNKLELMFWHRSHKEPGLIFGAQLNLNRLVDNLRELLNKDAELKDEICIALLDDAAKPVALTKSDFQAAWKQPFAATEIGDALPHWEVAAYVINPAHLKQAAATTRLTLSLLIALLVIAIAVGSWLIVTGMNAELKLARQKTDFVSNVSHELKTPLTSIRMFSELLAEGRVNDPSRQREYLNIITAEAARLTRLINNVLDFSRLESGEKKYDFQPCDLRKVVGGTAKTFTSHLEANGFKFKHELPDSPVIVSGDADALSQILVNLLSNAEKYCDGHKEIELQLGSKQVPLPHAEVRVLDRGMGLPKGSEEKIFEKFYRAHNSLSSGIQGSGLGLTIARQIARAHGGEIVYELREGGGSCFILRLPLQAPTK